VTSTSSVNIAAIAAACGDNAGIKSEGGAKIVLVQRNSKVEDARANEGDFIMRWRPDPLVRSSEGFRFQIYGVLEAWVEREKGRIVERYAVKPLGLDGKKLPNGNECEFEKHIYGAVDGDPSQVACFEVKKGGFRSLNDELMDPLKWQPPVIMPDGKKWKPGIFAYLIKVTSQEVKGDYGDYWAGNYEVLGRHPELITDEQLAAGADAFLMIEAQQKALKAEVLPPPLSTPKLAAQAPRIEITSRVEAPKSTPIVTSIGVTKPSLPPTAPPPTAHDGPGDFDDPIPF
jgi:hypothetical protein